MAKRRREEKIVEEKSGARLVAEALAKEGVRYIFTCPGLYDVMNECPDLGIEIIGGRNERYMVSAADGYARASGNVGVTTADYNLVPMEQVAGLGQAYAARTPILNMAYWCDPDFQAVDQMAIMKTVTKWSKSINETNDMRIPDYMACAFRELKTGWPRPVFIEFNSVSIQKKFQINSLRVPEPSRYRTEAKSIGDPEYVRKALAILEEAERPLIVSSSGVWWSKAWPELIEFAETMQIPVTESGPCRGCFPEDNILSASRSETSYRLTDVVLIVGHYAMPPPMETKGQDWSTGVGKWAINPNAKIIRIDVEAGDIGRALPVDVGIVGDSKAVLKQMVGEAKKMKHTAWLKEIAKARDEFEKKNQEYYNMYRNSTEGVHQSVIGHDCAEFIYNEIKPKTKTASVIGGYGIARYMRRYLRAYRPAQIIHPSYRIALIGTAVGFGIGVQVANGRENPILVSMGDGDWGYSGMEIETAAKNRLPLIVVIYNNNIWGTLAGARHPHTDYAHAFQENLRYDLMAEALGAHGEYVKYPGELIPALRESFKIAVEEQRPSVINCQAKKEYTIDPKKYPPGVLDTIDPGCTGYYG